MVNTYDSFIANITVDGKKCMISWYVEDYKVSHVEKHVNKRRIEVVAEHFGELTVSR